MSGRGQPDLRNFVTFYPLSYFYSRVMGLPQNSMGSKDVSNPYRISTVREFTKYSWKPLTEANKFQTPIVFLQSENMTLFKLHGESYLFQTPIVFLQSENSPYVGL
jgi:hypothetical protein